MPARNPLGVPKRTPLLHTPLVFLLTLSLLLGTVPPVQAKKPAEKTASEVLPASLFDRIPSGKNIRTIPQFSLIDDFDTHEKTNELGEPWETETPAGGRIRFRRTAKDAVNGKRGYSLRLSVRLPSGAVGLFKSSLKGNDASRAQAIAFRCRLRLLKARPFSGRLEIRLSDLEKRQQAYDFTPACREEKNSVTGWHEVVIPREAFGPINWGRLKDIQISITAGSGLLRSEIGLDSLAFYGKGDVKFESKKDNLFGFPTSEEAPQRVAELLTEPNSRKLLLEIAKDTWRYFENAIDRTTHLPVDHLRVGEPRDIGTYTTPTNLAMYFLACVSAHELGIISKKEALRRIRETMETLRLMKRWKGFHYNFYDTNTLLVTREYASAVDSGWLAAAWVVIRQAFPKALGGLATRFLEEMDFYEYYDPGLGQLVLGYDGTRKELSPYHYGLLATEARVASYVGIGKGNLPREHWWFIYRVPPKQWDWQTQVPEGREVEIDKVTFFEGHYTYQGNKFVPSWGGSMFEFLMPAMVLKEKELAPKGLGLNNRIATEIQIDYALNRQGYPVWGMSPASTSSGRLWHYGEYGVRYLGVKGYRDEGIITPYASFLALETLPEQAIDNLRKMLQLYKVYGEYGFYDSINVRTGRVNPQYLALDQGMILIALANYLKNGVIKEYFHKDEIGKAGEILLAREEFNL